MKRNNRSGMSLLETMIALAIMGMIAVILSSGLGSGARVLISSGRITQSVNQALARHDLRAWLEHALNAPFPGHTDGGLHGISNELYFSYVSDDSQFWPGDPVLVMLTRDDVGTVNLVADGTSSETQLPLKRTQILAENSSSIEVRYFGRLHPEDTSQWLDHWLPEAGLPDIIQIEVLDSNPSLPPLSIRPAKALLHSEISLSSALPPSLPSRP